MSADTSSHARSKVIDLTLSPSPPPLPHQRAPLPPPPPISAAVSLPPTPNTTPSYAPPAVLPSMAELDAWMAYERDTGLRAPRPEQPASFETRDPPAPAGPYIHPSSRPHGPASSHAEGGRAHADRAVVYGNPMYGAAFAESTAFSPAAHPHYNSSSRPSALASSSALPAPAAHPVAYAGAVSPHGSQTFAGTGARGTWDDAHHAAGYAYSHAPPPPTQGYAFSQTPPPPTQGHRHSHGPLPPSQGSAYSYAPPPPAQGYTHARAPPPLSQGSAYSYAPPPPLQGQSMHPTPGRGVAQVPPALAQQADSQRMRTSAAEPPAPDVQRAVPPGLAHRRVPPAEQPSAARMGQHAPSAEILLPQPHHPSLALPRASSSSGVAGGALGLVDPAVDALSSLGERFSCASRLLSHIKAQRSKTTVPNMGVQIDAASAAALQMEIELVRAAHSLDLNPAEYGDQLGGMMQGGIPVSHARAPVENLDGAQSGGDTKKSKARTATKKKKEAPSQPLERLEHPPLTERLYDSTISFITAFPPNPDPPHPPQASASGHIPAPPATPQKDGGAPGKQDRPALTSGGAAGADSSFDTTRSGPVASASTSTASTTDERKRVLGKVEALLALVKRDGDKLSSMVPTKVKSYFDLVVEIEKGISTWDLDTVRGTEMWSALKGLSEKEGIPDDGRFKLTLKARQVMVKWQGKFGQE